MRRNAFFARTVVSKAILASLCLAVPAGGAADVLDRTTQAAPANNKTWRTPKRIEADDATKHSLKVAFNETGDAIAFWMQQNKNMWSNSYDAGRGWGVARPIDSNAEEDIDNAKDDTEHSDVAMDGRGNAIFAWSRRGKIWINRYEHSKGWQKAQLIKNTGIFNTDPVFNLRLEMNKAGNVIAIWENERNILSKYYMADRNWDDIQLVATNAGGAYALLKVAMDGAGNAIAVWGQEKDFRADLWANRYEVGKGWQTAQIIKKNAGIYSNHNIAVDEAGNALVVWVQNEEGSKANIWSNYYVTGRGWQKSQRVNNGAIGCAEPPEVAFDRAGNALAVWSECQRGVNRTDLWFNRYTAGVGWQKAQRIETGDTNHAYYPQIAFDRAGNALAVWSQCKSKPTGVFPNDCNIWASRYVLGSGWEKAQPVTSDVPNAEHPQIAVDAAGNALAIWCQTDDVSNDFSGHDVSHYNIWAARYE